LAQGHTGDSIILNRCRYDLVFPWAVTIAVNLGVNVIFISNLSLILGKNSLVAAPFVVLSHSCCHFLMLIFLSWCSISLLGNLEYMRMYVYMYVCICLSRCMFLYYLGVG